MYKPRREGAVPFAQLLQAVAQVSPELRVRFTSPHPKDFSDEVLEVRISPAGCFQCCALPHVLAFGMPCSMQPACSNMQV